MDGADKEKDCTPCLGMRAFDALLNFCTYICMGMVFLAMIGICAHVFMRYFFHHPLNWTIDISSLFLFYITFLGMTWLLRHDGHVSLDFLYHQLGPVKYSKLEVFTNILCSLACLFVIYFAVASLKMVVDFDLSLDMAIAPPKWIIYSLVPIIFLFLAIEFGRKAYIGIKKWGK